MFGVPLPEGANTASFQNVSLGQNILNFLLRCWSVVIINSSDS